MGDATGVIGRLRVLAQLTLGSRGGVGTEVSCLHGWHRLPTGIVTGFSFTDPFEDVVESQDMPHFVDHDIGMARHAIIRGVEDDTTCNRRFGKYP